MYHLATHSSACITTVCEDAWQTASVRRSARKPLISAKTQLVRKSAKSCVTALLIICVFLTSLRAEITKTRVKKEKKEGTELDLNL